MRPEIVISIVSLLIAVASAVFAWQTERTARKAYSVNLLSQLYSSYQSDEMLRDLKAVWDLYRDILQKIGHTNELASEKARNGTLVADDAAINLMMELDKDSTKFTSLHNLINFWTYLELLLKKKAITPEEVIAFTSPKLLGFLYPMAKAYDYRYGSNQSNEDVLGFAYRTFA